MPDKKKTREQKQAEKVDKFTKEKQAELEKAGLSKPIDIGPMGEERQKRINEEVLKGVEGEVRSGLEKIQSLRTAPKVEVPEMPSDKYTIQDVRRERRAKIGDILTNFAQGSRGQTVTPRAYQNKLREERNAPYEQYKQTSEAAKKTLLDWENNYIDEQLAYLDKKYKDPNTTEAQKVQLKIKQAELETEKEKRNLIKSQADYYKNKPTSSTTSKQPYSTYEYKTDAGETIKIPFKSNDPNAPALKNAMAKAEQLKQQKKKAETDMYLAVSAARKKDKDEVRISEQSKVDELTKQISEAESNITTIFNQMSGNETPEAVIETEQSSSEIDPWEQ